ncbi:MAG: dihydrofolate reductase family protein [Actinomycetota bacterium]|nr:dihydrofolate reductase family protein [Actinomycetota bacterium]
MTYEGSRQPGPIWWSITKVLAGQRNVAEEVFKLERQPGKDTVVFRSAALANTLLEHDLVDEVRLMVFPVVVGSGKRLFEEGSSQKVLKLVDSRIFGTGVSSTSPTGRRASRAPNGATNGFRRTPTGKETR